MNKEFKDRDNAIKRGQAYNLAIQSAIADGKGNDNEYIIKQFLRHLSFAAFVQKASPEDLALALKSEKMMFALKELDRTIEE